MKASQPGAPARVFYGWWIATALLVVILFSHGIGYYVIPVVLKPISQEFGWSRAVVSGIVSVFVLSVGILAPAAGGLSDHYGPRRVMLVCAPFFAGGLALLSLTRSLWQLYAFYALVSVAVAGLHTVTISTTITRWFLRRRGTAMGITLTGMSLGGFLMAPLAGYLIQGMGWRTTFVVLGGLSAVFLLPLLWGVVRSSPEERGLLRDGEAAPPPPTAAPEPATEAFSLRGASWVLRSVTFWLIALSFFLVSGSFVGVLTHLVLFLTDLGVDPLLAASALGFTAGVGVLGKLGSGYLADRLSRVLIAVAFFSLQGLGLLLLMVPGGEALVLLSLLVFGLGVGAVAVLRPLIVGEFFGASSFGATYGWAALVAAFGSAAGAPFAGWVYDRTGGYGAAFTAFLAAYLMAILCLLLASRLRPRAWKLSLNPSPPSSPLPWQGRGGKNKPGGHPQTPGRGLGPLHPPYSRRLRE